MGMTPEQYFEAFVDLNRCDCHKKPGDIRHAFNAAVSASHLADHYFTYYTKHGPEKVKSHHKLGEFVEFLSNETNGAFQDIRSISNAYKHLYNTQGPSAKYETINSCGSIERLVLEDNEDIEELKNDLVDAEGRKSRWAVVFKRKDGTQGEFLPALDTVINYFQEILYE